MKDVPLPVFILLLILVSISGFISVKIVAAITYVGSLEDRVELRKQIDEYRDKNISRLEDELRIHRAYLYKLGMPLIDHKE